MYPGVRHASWLLLALGARPLHGQAPPPSQPVQTEDTSVATRARWLRPSEAAGAAAAILIGTAFDLTVRNEARAGRSATSNRIADIGNAAGDFRYIGTVLGAAWLTGTITGHRDLATASMRAAAAGLLAGGVTGILKVGFGRVRPSDGGAPGSFHPMSGNKSFPSGHATLASAIATSLAYSTPDGWSDVLFYGGAVIAGFARINHDKHWLSDVLAGSIIGYLVGRQVTLHHARLQPIIGRDIVGVAIEM